jgi:hypothetical protein
LRARGHAAPAPPPEIDDAVKAELLQFGFAEEHIIEALVQAQGSKDGAVEILLARPPKHSLPKANREQHKALFKAIKNNEHERIRELVATYPSILQEAASSGTTKAVGYAVQKIVFGDGITSVDMIGTLCELGAGVNDRGSDTSDTALLTAVMPSPHTERLVEVLLQRGADPHLTNFDGNTAVQECVNEQARGMLEAAAAQPPAAAPPPYVAPTAPVAVAPPAVPPPAAPPPATPPPAAPMIVVASRAIVRHEASLESEVIGTLLHGDRVQVEERLSLADADATERLRVRGNIRALDSQEEDEIFAREGWVTRYLASTDVTLLAQWPLPDTASKDK